MNSTLLIVATLLLPWIWGELSCLCLAWLWPRRGGQARSEQAIARTPPDFQI